MTVFFYIQIITAIFQIYRDTIMIGMACLCYNFVTACLSQHLNARYLTSISMAFGSLSAFLFVTFSSLSLCLTAISVFQSAMTTANVIIMSVIMAAFPSNLRHCNFPKKILNFKFKTKLIFSF